MRYLVFVLLFLIPAISVQAGTYGSCTDGTDCYCDQVADSGSDLYDASVLLCEDFEDAGLYDPADANSWVGTDTGKDALPYNRGNDSYWRNNYNNGVNSFLWNHGEPETAQIGSTCDVVSGFCVGHREWCSTDQGNFGASSYGQGCWNEGGATNFVLQDVIRTANDLTDVVGSLTLSGGNGTSGIIFDGDQTYSHRNESGRQHGIAGQKNWTTVTHIGVTMAMAYSSNMVEYSETRSPLKEAWKHEEFFDADNGDSLEFWFGGQQDGVDARSGASFPFTGFFNDASTQAACNTALGNATVTTGNFACDGEGNLTWYVDAGEYTQSTDWPWGTWGCVKSEVQFSGGNFSFKAWFNGNSGGNDVKVADISGFDQTVLYNSGISGMKWNSYINRNQNADPNVHTNVDLYRYIDNVHVTNGEPVSCDAIGFNQSTPQTSSKGVSFSYFREWAWMILGAGLLLAAAFGLRGRTYSW